MARKKKVFPTVQLGWRIDGELAGVLKSHNTLGPPPVRVLEALVLAWKGMTRDQQDALMQNLLAWQESREAGSTDTLAVEAQRFWQSTLEDYGVPAKQKQARKGGASA